MWQKYEKAIGHTYGQALEGKAATHVFNFDYSNLENSDAGVLVLPAGKSGHLELGYLIGQGKPCFILFPDGEPDIRWDVMYLFAHKVLFDFDDLLDCLNKEFSHDRNDLSRKEYRASFD